MSTPRWLELLWTLWGSCEDVVVYWNCTGGVACWPAGWLAVLAADALAMSWSNCVSTGWLRCVSRASRISLKKRSGSSTSRWASFSGRSSTIAIRISSHSLEMRAGLPSCIRWIFFCSNALIALARSLRKCVLAVLITVSEANAVTGFQVRGACNWDTIPQRKGKTATEKTNKKHKQTKETQNTKPKQSTKQHTKQNITKWNEIYNCSADVMTRQLMCPVLSRSSLKQQQKAEHPLAFVGWWQLPCFHTVCVPTLPWFVALR